MIDHGAQYLCELWPHGFLYNAARSDHPYHRGAHSRKTIAATRQSPFGYCCGLSNSPSLIEDRIIVPSNPDPATPTPTSSAAETAWPSNNSQSPTPRAPTPNMVVSTAAVRSLNLLCFLPARPSLGLSQSRSLFTRQQPWPNYSNKYNEQAHRFVTSDAPPREKPQTHANDHGAEPQRPRAHY